MNEHFAVTPADWIADVTHAVHSEPLGSLPAPTRVRGIWNVAAENRREFARIEILAEPADTWSVEDRVPEGSFGTLEPRRGAFLRSAILGMLDVLATSSRPPTLNVHIVFEDAKANPTYSDEEAFRRAGQRAASALLQTVQHALKRLSPPPPISTGEEPRIVWFEWARQERQQHRAYQPQLLANVTRALYQADPLGLAVIGAPADEYEPEASTILSRLPTATSVEDVRRIVREELIRWFGTWWLTWNPDTAKTDVEKAADAVWLTWDKRVEPK